MVLQAGSSSGWTLGTTGSGIIQIFAPANVPGNYMVTVSCNNYLSNLTDNPSTIGYGAGAQGINWFCYGGSRDNSSVAIGESASTSTSNAISVFGVQLPATYGSNFSLGGFILPAGSCVDIFVQYMNQAVLTRPVGDDSASSSSGCSFGLTPQQLNKMYTKLLSMGVLTNDDESPVVVAGDDGVVRISQADHDLPLGTSTSAPPLSKVTTRMRVLGK